LELGRRYFKRFRTSLRKITMSMDKLRKEFLDKVQTEIKIRILIRILWILAIVMIILFILFQLHVWGFYSGINKGIYFLNCGFEFTPDFGFFCGDY
jgi:hypothetical protein